MRLKLCLAALGLLVACTADDGATGAPETEVENSNEGERGEDAASARDFDGSPARPGDASTARSDAAEASSDGSLREDATAPDAATPAEDASSADAGSQEDAGADAGETPDASVGRCGTRGGIVCKAGEFCDFDPNTSCGANDVGGECKPIQKGCPKMGAPVCGCDKRSYANACVASEAGVSVLREGLCSPEECQALGASVLYSNGVSVPVCGAGFESWALISLEPAVCCLPKKPGGPKLPCGGLAGLACEKKQFCNYGKSCDGFADATGQCEALPDACTTEYEPVCGCDGKTYSSPCFAHAAGVSVKQEGACL